MRAFKRFYILTTFSLSLLSFSSDKPIENLWLDYTAGQKVKILHKIYQTSSQELLEISQVKGEIKYLFDLCQIDGKTLKQYHIEDAQSFKKFCLQMDQLKIKKKTADQFLKNLIKHFSTVEELCDKKNFTSLALEGLVLLKKLKAKKKELEDILSL